MKLPAALAAAIGQYAASLDHRSLTRAAAQLSADYRSGKNPQRLEATDRAAYLVTRLPATYAVATAVLCELQLRAPSAEVHSLLDLGAGPGTVAWAGSELFPSLENITLVERDVAWIELGRRLAADCPCAALRQAEWLTGDLSSEATERETDLVVVSYALGELPGGAKQRAVTAAWRAARQFLVLIEPGTPRGFQEILAARSLLLASDAHVVAPCPHARTCPMSEIEGEWCHFAQRLERTSLHRQLKAGELGYEDEKFSYLIVARSPVPPAASRIVRHPQQSKGRIELRLCALNGLAREMITRKNKALFRAARQAKWGGSWPPPDVEGPESEGPS